MIYISQLVPDGDLAQILREHRVGVESIEFSIGYCLDDLQAHVESYRERIKRLGNPSISVHGPFLDLNPASNDSLIRKVTARRFEQAYEAAAALSADRIIFHSGFLQRVHWLEGWPDLAVNFWEEFLDNKDDQIQIHMENVLDPAYAALAEVMDRLHHPAFSLCLDLGHANHASQLPLEQWIRQLGGRIGHIHIHDNDGVHDLHQAVGDGSIPWQSVMSALGQYCPDAGYTIENANLQDIFQTLHFLHSFHVE